MSFGKTLNTTDAQLSEEAVVYKKQSMALQTLKRLCQRRTAMIGLIALLAIVLVAILAPFTAPYDPNTLDFANANALPSLAHPFGCDSMGRDQLSRMIYGARYSLALGLLSALLGMVIGVVMGALAGYFGGWVDNVVMRLVDILMAIPSILLAICISTVLGPGFVNTIFALCIAHISGITRLLRAKILSARSEEYLEAAKSINCSTPRIIFKHLLPNVISPCIVNVTMGVGVSIMEASSLSFIGLGVQPPTPEWGAMLSAGRTFVRTFPHLIVFPGLVIAITILCINLFGDGLRDALDPKLKQ